MRKRTRRDSERTARRRCGGGVAARNGEEEGMANWKSRAGKAVDTLRRDGLRKTGEKTKLYLKRKREERSEEMYADHCFRDVLFINGCDEHLPHPGRYRVTHQREQLESLGVRTGEVYFQNLKLDTARCYRTFVFFRCPYTERIGEFVELARALNKSVLYDVDDLVIDTAYTDQIGYLDTFSPEERLAYDENVRSMGKLLRLCDGAVTTTACLAEELKRFVPQVYINRNTASEEMVKRSLEAVSSLEKNENGDGNRVRLGYFSGSITHNDDLRMILPVLTRLLKENRSLQLCLTGEVTLPEELRPYVAQIETRPFADWRELPAMIAGVDINLAPLTDTIFNRAKSEIKWLEAALVKVPTVASGIGAFAEMVENGKTGLLCRSAEEWERALRALIDQPRYRARIGEAAFAFCMERCTTAVSGQGLASFLRERQKKAVAFVLPAFQISGGVMVTLQHARILQDAGNDVTLFSIQEGGKERWYDFEGNRFPVLNCHDTQVPGRIDLGVATMWSTVDWLRSCPAILKKAYLVQNYEPDFYAPGDPLRLKARETYGADTGLMYLTISRWCQRWLAGYGHEARYAPNGLALDRFAGRRRSMNGRVRILVEGDSTAPHKNVDESFHILERLDRKNFEIWYMAYHGEPKEWYPVDRFLPEVPYGKVHRIYRQCDILLKSSTLESFSYPPLEMMATGGFVVAVQNEGNREYLRDGENGLCYPKGEIRRGAEAILRICKDKTLRELLYRNGIRTAALRDWEILREQILNLYQ